MVVKKMTTSELWVGQCCLHQLQKALGINQRIQVLLEGGQAAVFRDGLVCHLELHVLHDLRHPLELPRQLGDGLGERLHVAAEGGDVNGERLLLLQRQELRQVQGTAGDVRKQPWTRLDEKRTNS